MSCLQAAADRQPCDARGAGACVDQRDLVAALPPPQFLDTLAAAASDHERSLPDEGKFSCGIEKSVLCTRFAPLRDLACCNVGAGESEQF